MLSAVGIVARSTAARPAQWKGLGRVVSQGLTARLFSSDLPPHTALEMPALSPTMESGNLASWLVEEGAEVAAGDAIMEIETDKSTVSFDVQDDGFIAKIVVPGGTSDVKVGAVLGVMVEEEEDIAAFADYTADDAGAAPAAAPEPQPEPAAAPSPPAAPAAAAAPAAPAAAAPSSGDRVFASPLARTLLREAGVDVGALAGRGTGPAGRVIAEDARAYLAAPPAAAVEEASGFAQVAAAADAQARGAFADIPHTAMRRVIASRLTDAKRNVPHYYLTSDVKLDALLELREQLNAELGEKLSVNDFLIKASALALRKVPQVNSSWLENNVRQYDFVDVAVAVATEDGLITPIVTDADQTGLSGISSSVRDLASRARDRKLAPHEYQGGTFTISNLGMFGVKQFAAIINPPQAAILAVGAAEKRVVPATEPQAEKPYTAATVMSVTLSCDHRVVDGAVGAQWLSAFRGYIESPTTMLL